MVIPHSKSEVDSVKYVANFTIFIAIAESPEAGLDGTLSICVTPDYPEWNEVSLMYILNQ